MLKRLIRWLKKLFGSLFGTRKTASQARVNVQEQAAPPLDDTDLEFLFNELLQGVHQARGQTWALQWLHNIEHRISTERWVEWLRRFGEKLLASPTPNNELAARLVQLGELGVGEIGEVAYDIGIQLLTRNQGEPVWEYEGPDAVNMMPLEDTTLTPEEAETLEQLSEEGYQSVTIDELFVMLQQDENLRQQIAQQLAVESDDPQVIVEALINQFYASQSTTEQPET